MRKAARAIIIRDGQLLVMRRHRPGNDYYTLVGGGIEADETPEEALRREVSEETGFNLTNSRLVFTEEQAEPYGTQYIFLCQFEGEGSPHLLPTADEAKFGQDNQHTPQWVAIKDTSHLRLLSDTLKTVLVYALGHGFPTTAVLIDADYIGKLPGTNITGGRS
jgi:8-oxo-dGTP pyrophosphatase MutT (NUDIX family)